MDRREPEQVEYGMARHDGDPLAVFADEPAASTPEPPIPQEPEPRRAPAPLAVPEIRPRLREPRVARPADRPSVYTKLAAAGLITGCAIAFGAGAFMYVNHSSAPTRSTAENVRPLGPRPEPPPDDGAATRGTIGKSADNTAPISPSAPSSLTGQWSVKTQIQSSNLKRYHGLRLEYQVRLEQVGDEITGAGYKLRENDHIVRSRTPITLTGDVMGDRVVLKFQERGARRVSSGTMVLERESEDVLRGRFSSDAAKSRGVADARR